MIISEPILKKLRNIFDLNIYEVKIWTALLSRGVASAGELADISGVPRSRTYDVLDGLEKKGFIIMKLGKPIKYLAIKPEDVLSKVKSNIDKKTQEKLNMLDKVKETDLFGEINLLYSHGIEKIDANELSGVLKGRKNINDHLKNLINDSQHSVIITTTEEGLSRKYDLLKNTLKKAKKRGVDIKISAPANLELPFLKDLKKLADISNIKDQRSRFVIVDSKHIVFMISDDKDVHEAYDLGIWVNTPFFAKTIEQMFNKSWDNKI